MKLTISSQAVKSLKKIPVHYAQQIVFAIKQLPNNPSPPNSLKLAGQNNRRLRVGIYRIIYFIDKKNQEIGILRIAHRKEIYQ